MKHNQAMEYKKETGWFCDHESPFSQRTAGNELSWLVCWLGDSTRVEFEPDFVLDN